jgi:hypothetical protein
MTRFSVTYEIVTQESAEQGDTDESGFIGEGLDLRSALDAVRETRTNEVGGAEVHPSASDVSDMRWISVANGMEFRTGAYETRSLHIPDGVSDASRGRILKLMREFW